MRNLIYISLVLILTASIAIAANTISYPRDSGYKGRLTATLTTDLNDLSLETSVVSGVLKRVVIDSTGTETDWTVTIQDDLGVSLFTKTDCNSVQTPYSYAFSIADTAGNDFSSVYVSGPLTIITQDVNSTPEVQTLDPNGAATRGPFYLTYEGESTAHVNEVVRIADINDPNGGTFKLTFGGQQTASVAYNCTAAVLDAALEALSSIDANEVVCTGGPLPGNSIYIEFTEGLGWQNVGAVTLTTNALTVADPNFTASIAISVLTAGQGLVYNSTTAAIQTALEALSTVKSGDVTVGGATLAVATGTTFTFDWMLGDVDMIDINDTYLTGPAQSPIVETTKGSIDLSDITVTIFYEENAR